MHFVPAIILYNRLIHGSWIV